MNALQLLQTLKDKRNEWDECSQFVVNGIGDLSLSDIYTIEIYAEKYLLSGKVSFGGLIEPIGKVKEVLDSYGISPMITSTL